jgi:hypothetical protein
VGFPRRDLDRTDAQRRADALVKIFRDAAGSLAGTIAPGWVHNIHWSAQAYEEMLAAMDADRQPRFDPETFMCRTDDGHDVDPTEAAANSLLHKVRRVIVDAAGVVIDLGRARRFTGSARTAATATYTHCVWAGCHAPASRCEIDHLHEHGRGGETTQANSAPLCGKHNRWKQKGFTIQRTPAGTWHTTRPDGSQLSGAYRSAVHEVGPLGGPAQRQQHRGPSTNVITTVPTARARSHPSEGQVEL